MLCPAFRSNKVHTTGCRPLGAMLEGGQVRPERGGREKNLAELEEDQRTPARRRGRKGTSLCLPQSVDVRRHLIATVEGLGALGSADTTSAEERMKLSYAAVAAVSIAVLDTVDAFSLASRGHGVRCSKIQRAEKPRPSSVALKMSDFGSDFASAMPAKPELSMKEKLEESATVFIADIESRLADGVDAPPEIEALKEARDSPDCDEKLLALRIYELMIEQGMLYDIDAETGKLSLTNFDIKNNLDIPEVKAEFAHLYKYGMQLIGRDLIDIETCKGVVQKRLIDRTGLTPEKFDEWLGY